MSDEKRASRKTLGHKVAAAGNSDIPQPGAPPAAQPDKALADGMAKYGITQVPVDYFHYGEFRYTNLKDAIAQAKMAIRV